MMACRITIWRCRVRRYSLNWFPVPLFWSFRWILGQADFICSESVQSMMCALGRINKGHKVVFCPMLSTPSRCHHPSELLTCIELIQWQIPETFVNACWVQSAESVSMMKIILSVYLPIFLHNMWECICQAGLCKFRWLGGYICDSSLYHHQIEVSIIPVVVIFSVAVCPWLVYHHMLLDIYIPGNRLSFITIQFYHVCK